MEIFNNDDRANAVFDPIAAVNRIVTNYKRYIRSTFKTDKTAYNEQIASELDNYQIIKGPYLQMPNRYQKGDTIGDLVSAGRLSGEFLNLDSSRLDPDMHLYIHQINALNNIIGNDHSTVISTGTGSGKTESFLIPILDYLFREVEAGTIREPGVRAMVIYPMNALVNDQIKRFSEILENYSEVTFGFFTGESRDLTDENDFKSRFHRIPLPNELYSVKQMTESPPHILITNYAMLEHILIRPENAVEIFNPLNAQKWKYIVLDEVHTYSGAKGSEVAMLLRRVCRTISSDKIRFILTSATLGFGQDAFKQTAAFASELVNQEIDESDIICGVSEDIRHPDDYVDVPEGFFRSIIEHPNNIPADAAAMMVADNRFDRMIRVLERGVKSLDELSEELGMNSDDLVLMIEAAFRIKRSDGSRLFDVRYHTFIRTLEGVYLTLSPSNRISFTKAKTLEDSNEEYALFTLSTCYSCGAIYIPGRVDGKQGVLKNIDSSEIADFDGTDRDKLFLLCDEDDFDPEHEEDYYYVCSKCRQIWYYDDDQPCDCESECANLIREVVPSYSVGSKLCTCHRCGQANNKFGIVRDFYLGTEAATAALASSLFETIPEPSIQNNQNEFHPVKQFLMFSDSRTSASYAAVNLQEGHHNLLMHRLQVDIFNSNEDDRIGFDKFYRMLSWRNLQGFVDSDDHCFDEQSKMEAGAALLQEAVNSSSSKSLEYMGVYRYEYGFRESIGQLDAKESYALLNTIIKLMRERGAVSHGDDIGDWDPEHKYVHGSGFLSLDMPTQGPEPPKKKKNNGESSRKSMPLFRGRLLKYIDIVATGKRDEIEAAIKRSGCFVTKNGDYSVDLSKLIIVKSDKLFECTVCRKHFPFSVRNICPICFSELVEIDPPIYRSDDVYAFMYRNMPMDRLEVREHTAQLSKEKATSYQNDFVNQKINTLSCSTTFEMGVDIGSLSYVFMRNVPPSPSNYAQRSGRAGRSDTSSAFILTFCRGISHDSHYFNHPESIIAGDIQAPHINILNPKIVVRHIFATAISFFWKKQGMSPKHFIDMSEDEYVDDFCNYLYSEHKDLDAFLSDIVPKDLLTYHSFELSLDLANHGWIETLIGKTNGRLALLIQEYKRDIQSMEEEMGRLSINKEFKSAESYNRSIKSMRNEDTLFMLSRGNVIPRYGFPIDTIGLTSPRFFVKESDFDLQRDMLRAIAEFAPGCCVVADGKIIESTHMKRMSNETDDSLYHSEDKYQYIVCKNCGTISYKLVGSLDSSDSSIECLSCHGNEGKPGFLIVPRLGFTYSKRPVRATVNKPRRPRGVSVYFSKRGNPMADLLFSTGPYSGMITICIDSEMMAVTNDRYKICERCGYGYIADIKPNSRHIDRFKNDCQGKLRSVRFAYPFLTDIAIIRFDLLCDDNSAKSVLYAIIEGLCREFEIERSEVDGCLITSDGSHEYIIFDKTPGGSGYVRAITSDSIIHILNRALEVCENCDCGGKEGDGSCYRCLRNYYNQKDHEVIRRGAAISYIRRLLGRIDAR